DQAVPFVKKAQHSARRFQSLQSAVTAEKQPSIVSAIRVAQPPLIIVIFSKEDRCIGALDCVFVKELVHRSQKALWLLERHRALTPQICLKICHQQRSSNPLAGNVTDDDAQLLLAEAEEVVIVAANLASLEANAAVIERLKRRQPLRK